MLYQDTLTIPEFNENVTVANGTLLEVIVTARVPSYVKQTDTLYANAEIYLDDKMVFLISDVIDTSIASLPSPVSNIHLLRKHITVLLKIIINPCIFS